ncbi:MAG: von Willebrand factor type A domain-containing protein, partial [Clostridia bacterium]|nr:von Willebrand factor type A domain-containing protein [Clostridia bacterium]
MKLKKLFLFATTLLMCASTFVSCSIADGGGMANMGAMMDAYMPEAGAEEYTEIIENAFINTSEQPSSYFSIDANTASYPNLRSLINMNANIPKDAVRVEEMLNYFDYDYATPEGDDILGLTSSVFDTPYNAETKILTVGLAAKEVEFTEQQNNIVFLIDVSGSMNSADKLPLVQLAFSMLAENLNDGDRVSIVTYAGEDKVALDGAYGYEKKKIVGTIEDLSASGSTAGSKGIRTAYSLAEKYFIEGGNNRVILATDGDFNVGLTALEDLETYISNKRKSGVYFSVFGFGRGNIKSDKMETLALNGNGTYSYIDSINEAKRALVTNIGGTMLTVAKDVKAGIIFNPDYVES